MQERHQKMKEHHKKHKMVCIYLPAQNFGALLFLVILKDIWGLEWQLKGSERAMETK